MKNWKKVLLGAVSGLLALSLAGCGGEEKKESSEPYVPKELKVQFVPSQAAETLEAKAKPLEKLLKEELDIPVKVSVATDYNTIVEALDAEQIDVGFLPPNAYVEAHERSGATVLLQALRYGINQKGGVAEKTNKLVENYRAEVLVAKDSKIKDVNDLKGKTIAVQDVTSSAGYVYPVAELKDKGIDINKDVQTVQVKGHDQAVLSVLNGDVDAAFVFEDARLNVLKDQPDIMQKVIPIYFTKAIPNDTITVRGDMSKEWKEKIQNAFIKIGKTKEGKKIISSLYTHEGYVKTDDKTFDTVREYAKKVGQ